MPRLAAFAIGLALLALVAGAGLVWRAFAADMAEARARLVGQSQVIQSPWGPIEYAEAGLGPPVLMIHGSGGGFDQGLKFSRPLTQAGFRVIAPSRFGYLRSAIPANATPAMQADALAFLMQRLGLRRAMIVGGSAGALSATELALRHPELCQGLALLVPATYAPDRAPNTSAAPNAAVSAAVRAMLNSDFLFWLVMKTAPDLMSRQLLATEPAVIARSSPLERERVGLVLSHILPVSQRTKGLMMDAATAGSPKPQPVEQLRCPLLAISAQDDLYGTAKSAAYVARRAPEGRAILYDTGGHLWVGHNADIWREISAFGRDIQGR